MRSAIAANAWAGVARIRSAHPAYGGIMPASVRWRLVLGAGRVGLAAILSVVVALLINEMPMWQPLVYLIAISGVVGGVKRGQRQYLEERERAHSLTLLLGAPATRAYYWTTSAVVVGESLLIFPIALAAGTLLARASLPSVALVAVAFVVGRVGGEVTAHAAVLLSAVKIPQYVFAGAGLAMGAALQYVTPTPGRTFPLPDWNASLAVGALVVLLAVPLVRAFAGSAMRFTVATGVSPLAFRNRRLPLALRLWTTSDRKTSSLTMGMLAIGVVISDRVHALGPAAMSGLQEFQRVDLLVALCYVLAYMLASVIAEPLTIPDTGRRASLLALVDIPAAREIWSLARAALAPVAVITSAFGMLLWSSFDLGVPSVAWLAAVVLVSTGACAAVLVGKVPHLAPRSGGQVSEASVGTMAKTVLLALWPATSALGFLAEAAPVAGWVSLLVTIALIGAVALVLLDLSRTIRLRCKV